MGALKNFSNRQRDVGVKRRAVGVKNEMLKSANVD